MKILQKISTLTCAVLSLAFAFAVVPAQAQFTEIAKLLASDKQNGDFFGHAAAISGDYAIVGAYAEDTGASEAGAAYIYERSGGVWSQVAKIQASDKQGGDQFGWSVAISGDRAIVGAYNEDTGGTDAGAAYIFERSGGVWSQVAKIQASGKQAGDNFGVSVAISGDRAMVGAYWEDTGGSNAGAAYIFELSAGVWSQVAKIQASDKQADDNFGFSVAISGDHAIVGAMWEDTGGTNAGAAYIFERSGGVWSEVAKIQASDKQAGDQFGWSVGISDDRAIAGAWEEDTGGTGAGAAYIFERSGGVWSQVAKIQASDKQLGDRFGSSVAISGDRIIVGAFQEDAGASNAGAAYIFERSGGVWSQVAKILASDRQSGDQFGYSAGISGDRIIVGADSKNIIGTGPSTGAAYVFEPKSNQPPVANAGADQSVCTSTSSANITLDGSGSSDPDNDPLTYTWKEGATTLATGVNPTISLSVGLHTTVLTVDDGKGGTDTNEVTISVHASPSVSVNSPTVCASELPVTLTASVSSSTAPFSYVWTVPGGAVDPGDVDSFNATVAGSYSVVVTDANGCTGTGSGTLTVNQPPTVNAGADKSIAPGGSGQIGGSPTASDGLAPYTYAWSPTTGLNDATIANPAASPASTTTYTVTVTDANGCAATDEVIVTAALVANAGADKSIAPGGNVQIGGSPTASDGTAPYTYSWSPTTGLNDATLANPTANPAATTIYTVTVTDANNDIATDEMVVTVVNLANFIVTTANDIVDGNTASIADLIADQGADGKISLREAISACNNTPGADEIRFANSINGTPIVLNIGSSHEGANADGDLDIIDADGLTITGNGESNTIIDGNDTERVIDHYAGDLTITGLTIQNGNSTSGFPNNGGGIQSSLNVSGSGEFTMSNCTLTGNDAGGRGGAISIGNTGNQTLSNCTFSNNHSGVGDPDGFDGGAVYISGVLGTEAKINACAFVNNSSNRRGGALAYTVTDGKLLLEGSIFTGNTATLDGGALYANPSNGTAIIANSVFSGNSAGVDGGGLSLSITRPVMLHMSNCTVSDNTAGRDGGGIDFDSLEGLFPIINSTISGNRANRHGGGIAHNSRDGVLNLNFVTINNNIADDDADGVGEGGGVDINETFGTVTLNIHNSIVQGNDDETPTQTSADDCGNSGGIGTYVSQGGNVFGNGTGCPVGANDTTDPANLGPLQNNGGAAETHALLAGSAAINFADCDTVTVDQIGNPRPFGGACDAGAVESSFGPASPFVFVAKELVKIDQNKTSEGDIQSNYGDVNFNKGAPGTHTGNLFAGRDITIDKQNTIVGNATAKGEIYRRSGATITGSKNPHTSITVMPLPNPSFSASGLNKTVKKNSSLTLSPGSYGTVKVETNGTLNLSAGNYYMKALMTDASAKIVINASGEVKINIVSNLVFGQQTSVNITGGGTEQVTFATLQYSKVQIGQKSVVRGTLIAHHAEVHFDKECKFKGTVYAESITIDAKTQFYPHTSSSFFKENEEEDSPSEDYASNEQPVTSYELEQNYPNPFNPTTTISFQLPENSDVTLSIFNTNGQLVKRLVAGEMSAGHHSFTWDATDQRGERVSSGVYLYVIKAGTFTARRKLVLMK